MLKSMQPSSLDARIKFGIYAILTIASMAMLFLSLVQYGRNEQQKKERDHTRLSDINTIQQALEAYYNDHNEYPLSVGFGRYSLCAPQGCPTKTYLKDIPQDPIEGQTYQYIPIRERQEYALYTCLEKEQGNGDYTLSCNCEGNGSCKYKLNSKPHAN